MASPDSTQHLQSQEKSENRYTYRLDIAYDGSLYAGWQIQPNAVTIQEVIEEKLAVILQEHYRITGAGRTDAGVHAFQQVAHFTTTSQIDLYRVQRSLNGTLPHDIRILNLQQVSCHFHARKSAQAKEYHYTLVTGPYVLPFDRKYVWHIFTPLDASLLHKAAARFVGTHDFFAYANENTKGAAAKNSVRTIYEVRVHIEDIGTSGDHSALQKIRLEFYGNGFLYKMVRNITGMIVAVASGKRPIEDIDRSFEERDRKAVDRAAPPQGLTLVRIDYPASIYELM